MMFSAMTQFTPFDVQREGVVLHGRIGGSGAPLLLLHGHPQTHVIWHRVAPALAERFTVIAMDLRTRLSTRYVYLFTKLAGHPWVREASLEKLARSAKAGAKSNLITIRREEPSDPDGAPKRWSALSSRGEIRVRWKDRTVTSVNVPQSSESLVK